MTNLPIPPLELAGRLAMVIGLAVFLGLAFEEVYKSEERAVPGGIRTFPMLAVSGAMLYLIEPAYALAFVAGLIALGLWLFTYLRAVSSEHGVLTLMIPASNLLAYVIGPIALTQPAWVAVALAVTAVLLLGARERLHRLTRVVPQDELLTAGRFLILVGIVLPLAPDEAVTKLTPLTPHDMWLAVVAICTLSYISYLLQRYVRLREGALLPAVLGGAYSSTATTIVLAKRQREAGAARAEISAGIVVATAIMYVRLGIVVALFDLHLALALAPALAALFAIGAALAGYEWYRIARASETSLAVPALNPLQITAAAVFAVLFVIVSLISTWVRGAFGQSGILVLSAIVGATDIDPFVLNIAQGGVGGMSGAALAAAVLIAASSNNVMKAAYALGFGGVTTTARPAILLLLLAFLGLGAAALYVV